MVHNIISAAHVENPVGVKLGVISPESTSIKRWGKVLSTLSLFRESFVDILFMYICVHYLNLLMNVMIFWGCICITTRVVSKFLVSLAFVVLLVYESHLLSSFGFSLKVLVGKKCDKENDC